MQIPNFTEILILLAFLLFAIVVFIVFRIRKVQYEIERDLVQSTSSLKAKSVRLKKMATELTEQPKKMNAAEMDHVTNEILNITGLWKSRREKLSRGMWEKIEFETEEPDVVADDEKSKLKKEKERIEELMKKTKIKYRTREIDEQAFRDIMTSYQKELMEVTLKLSELDEK